MALELSETEIRKFTLQDAMHELCKYCAPLLFINSLALFGVADLPRAEALNGTLTLVTFEGKTYAISLLSQRLCVEGAQLSDLARHGFIAAEAALSGGRSLMRTALPSNSLMDQGKYRELRALGAFLPLLLLRKSASLLTFFCKFPTRWNREF